MIREIIRKDGLIIFDCGGAEIIGVIMPMARIINDGVIGIWIKPRLIDVRRVM